MQDIETTATDASGDNPRRLAHDLNNAMASIIGSVDLANLKVPADDPARRYLEQIGSSAERAAGLIQRLIVILRRDYPDDPK
ncbi:MAG TPA: histidine kinase dimerization/phospho-acceptor domain-containing protein [Spirochaetota bacterium]|nr:histidine kinase dimerization/phospho-acceptor domain-containing protein [Spirochaetota bacterium]HOS41502.1 histidine kinase dimerization/phospho-acceptor domain-containing protein [Spirochaetota bacterium]HPI22102.1 histidine kinase dimerization/phospho-acceptor domain-containing protein [Spirochaetota bacterium]HPU88212.1 histidine kinase dimerization/phospho-acceptor domain-containing protein [Spirochaetota bacterium]